MSVNVTLMSAASIPRRRICNPQVQGGWGVHVLNCNDYVQLWVDTDTFNLSVVL